VARALARVKLDSFTGAQKLRASSSRITRRRTLVLAPRRSIIVVGGHSAYKPPGRMGPGREASPPWMESSARPVRKPCGAGFCGGPRKKNSISRAPLHPGRLVRAGIRTTRASPLSRPQPFSHTDRGTDDGDRLRIIRGTPRSSTGPAPAQELKELCSKGNPTGGRWAKALELSDSLNTRLLCANARVCR